MWSWERGRFALERAGRGLSRRRPLAVFGGTFNPVHNGHLRSAAEVLETLELAEIRFMPAALPPHREVPSVSAEDRAAMLELAIAGEARFRCDRRELERAGPSYSYDSLLSLREELGEEQSLSLLVGCDALLGLPGWYRWRELFDLAHVLVMARPGWALPTEGVVAELLRERAMDVVAVSARPAGGVLTLSLTPWDISATAIRGLLQSGHRVEHLLPERVLDYIRAHRMYENG
ncbi:MAG: nicotinate-nucleotide adenylyltransferase [Halieaceae bacterium]|jgi:nicotinate-nucleotide adenylyltransferase